MKFREVVITRIQKLIEGMLSLSFLTWLSILAIKMYNKETLNMDFYMLTAAIIGIKSFSPKAEVKGA